MAQELSENTKLTLDIKTIAMIVSFAVSLVTVYFSLKSEIAVAMTEPKPEVSSVEFQYKDQLVRSTVEKIDLDLTSVKSDVEEMKETLKLLESRIFELTKQQ